MDKPSNLYGQGLETSKGFSLVEMAVVMVVVGLLVAMGASMIGPLTSRARMNETRENMSGIMESVASWAASNNRIPPFTPVAPDAATFLQIARKPDDSWGGPLLYLYDTALAPTGVASLNISKDTICGRRTTTLYLVNTTSTPTVTVNNIAYLIISTGDDRTAQTTINGTLNGGPVNGVVTGSGPATGTVTLDATFSDIARWVTLDELRAKIGCQGAQLRIVNNELPPATVSAQYPNATAGSALTLSVDGGATPGTYRWCIEALTATPLPGGLSFNTTTPALPVRVTPLNTCSTLPEANWGAVAAAPNLLTISGTPSAGTAGAYSFTIYVRDNNDATGSNDNIASKAFVLTVNP